MSEKSLGQFRIANDLLGDRARLDALFAEDGYLFFRDVLDATEVNRVKTDMMRVLSEQGVVKAGESEPIWTGAGLEQIEDTSLYALESYPALVEGSVKTFAETIFGEPVFMQKGTSLRYSLPGGTAYVTPAHQDYYFIRGNDSFRTFWIPVMDIGAPVGGLVVAQGSHKAGLRPHNEQEVFSYVLKGRRQSGVLLDDIAEPALTIDYRPGDVLIMHNLTLHWALPNVSDRVRLSIDSRGQPASAHRTFQMEVDMLTLRQYRKDAQRIAFAEGASEPQFEKMIIEMMKRHTPAESSAIRALMAEMATASA